eukprot:TRINITY_DN19649_c0_g1_i1.p1 TRINITY_DN19649_c0_g1~~TRINITY_DN19649_c0_g1_i1.p1  ORF type:complete len:387 (-),score=86.08 TRINITY_DN19649_c0_g1_i1:98-1258(-)
MWSIGVGLVIAALCPSACDGGKDAGAKGKPWEADESKLLVRQVKLKGGAFRYGPGEDERDSRQQPGRQPPPRGSRRTKVTPFAIDATSVTNDQFRRFVRDTRYVTEAENFSWSFVFHSEVPAKTLAHADGETGMGRVKEAPHWVAVEGASWRRPEGPESSIKGRGNHPVVHVSYADAQAYCKWANGRRLPTEKEWEFAARGGHDEEPFPWGEDPTAQRVNGWQGKFPDVNTKEDGWVGPAPVTEYDSPNAYGMHNMLGNVWEWAEGGSEKARPLRGGSYVDTIDGSHNDVLRVWTRMENSPDSGSHNTGFRCASGKRNRNEAPAKSAAARAQGLDQEKLQEILAERGRDGLEQWLKEQGVGGSVMTPAELQQRRDDLQKMKSQMEL